MSWKQEKVEKGGEFLLRNACAWYIVYGYLLPRGKTVLCICL